MKKMLVLSSLSILFAIVYGQQIDWSKVGRDIAPSYSGGSNTSKTPLSQYGSAPEPPPLKDFGTAPTINSIQGLLKTNKGLFNITNGILNLQSKSIGDLREFRNIPGIETVRIIKLDSNKIPFIKQDTFSWLTNLQGLSLSGNQITDAERGAFNGLSNLQYIHLAGNKMDTATQRRIKGEIKQMNPKTEVFFDYGAFNAWANQNLK